MGFGAEIISKGYAVLSGLSDHELNQCIEEISSCFPDCMMDAKGQDLRPFPIASAPKHSMSSIVGLAQQPPHTDGAYLPCPPRLMALRCIERGDGDCPTHIWSLDWDRLQCVWPQDLTRPLWMFRHAHGLSFYAPILDRSRDRTARIRFDPLCMFGRGKNTEDFAEMIRLYANEARVFWQEGDCLVIDNWRALHFRGEGAGRTLDRRLRRWYWRTL